MSLTRDQYFEYQQSTKRYLDRVGIVLTPAEVDRLEIADFGLNEFETTGLGLITYVNTDRVCAKELVLLPGQTCPQHMHPSVDGQPGKEETFRCRSGTVYLYVSGTPTPNRKAQPPQHRAHTYDVFHEVVLEPGDQYTLVPGTWHWFQGGPDGAVVSEFSTRSTDERDLFTDRDIQRAPVIES